MTYKRLTQEDIAQIMKLRALGYNTKEISQRINCTRSTISYHLKRIHDRAENGEEEDLFWSFVASVTGFGFTNLLRKLSIM